MRHLVPRCKTCHKPIEKTRRGRVVDSCAGCTWKVRDALHLQMKQKRQAEKEFLALTKSMT
jgi:hypothetical protein